MKPRNLVERIPDADLHEMIGLRSSA